MYAYSFLLFLEFYNIFPVPSVSPGGKNSSEAAASVCGVLRVQRPAADRSHRLRGHQKRYLNTGALLVFYVQTEQMMCVCFPGSKPWSNAMEILHEKDGVDTELLVYAMTLVNKVC